MIQLYNKKGGLRINFLFPLFFVVMQCKGVYYIEKLNIEEKINKCPQ